MAKGAGGVGKDAIKDQEVNANCCAAAGNHQNPRNTARSDPTISAICQDLNE